MGRNRKALLRLVTGREATARILALQIRAKRAECREKARAANVNVDAQTFSRVPHVSHVLHLSHELRV